MSSKIYSQNYGGQVYSLVSMPDEASSSAASDAPPLPYDPPQHKGVTRIVISREGLRFLPKGAPFTPLPARGSFSPVRRLTEISFRDQAFQFFFRNLQEQGLLKPPRPLTARTVQPLSSSSSSALRGWSSCFSRELKTPPPQVQDLMNWMNQRIKDLQKEGREIEAETRRILLRACEKERASILLRMDTLRNHDPRMIDLMKELVDTAKTSPNKELRKFAKEKLKELETRLVDHFRRCLKTRARSNALSRIKELGQEEGFSARFKKALTRLETEGTKETAVQRKRKHMALADPSTPPRPASAAASDPSDFSPLKRLLLAAEQASRM